ncbi:syntaxin-6 [Phlebotomus argentipes]|uniref:syntaxin-6 n=1 Tax=Phlebotomus argentipes TaxID=94469 RepID=UPI002892DE02|nr:syntaxin-6 [Phlebotomus argentipes]XP_059614282.1 syntaxin-6 [Phlebotomus argentipes]
MSLEDPFFVVKDEVFKALNKTRGLYLRWRELGDSSGAEVEWTTTELRNSLRSIEWDLEDLEDTIGIVEKNPSKFKIDNRELITRRHFIEATRHEVKSMKDEICVSRSRDRDITARQPLLDAPTDSPSVITAPPSLMSSATQNLASAAARHSGTKYSKLENTLDSPTHFLGESVSAQQRMFQSQDEQLDVISDSIGTLKTVSRQINTELDEQAVMLDDFGNELDNTDSKLDSTMKKMAKVLHMTNDSRQWMAIGVLSLVLLIVIILFILL